MESNTKSMEVRLLYLKSEQNNILRQIADLSNRERLIRHEIATIEYDIKHQSNDK